MVIQKLIEFGSMPRDKHQSMKINIWKYAQGYIIKSENGHSEINRIQQVFNMTLLAAK
jgi:hypothetical protein